MIQVGTGAEMGPEVAAAVSAGLIPLPRAMYWSELELAAAHADTGGDVAEQGQGRVETGGIEFLCRDRRGGCDLTIVVTGVTAGFADESVGVHGVGFATTGRDGGRRPWIVPLAPSPRGLTGTLYGIDEDYLHAASVSVRRAEELADGLDDQLDEVVLRSVRHADTDTAWSGLSGRLAPGRLRTAVEAALAEHETS